MPSRHSLIPGPNSRQAHATRQPKHNFGGLVTLRQRPATASGTVFVTLEDEDGMVNVVIWPRLAERQRRVLLTARLLGVDGRWESVDGVQNLIARRLHDYSPLLGTLDTRSRDFH